MSMRRSSRSELRMLRVMVTHFGLVTRCYFCHKPLLELAAVTQPTGLNIAGKTPPLPIKTKLTIHHKDGNHHNNKKSNRKPCHQTCHKSYHMKERQAQKKEKQ